MSDRLYRSRDDRVIAGVAAGVAEQLDLDPSLVRVGWVILAIVTGGLLALVYVVMMVVVPEEPGPGDWRGWTASPGAAARPPEPPPAAPADAPAAAPGDATPATPPTGDRPTETIPPPGWSAAATPPPSDRDPRAAAREERAAAREARRRERAARRAARRDSNSGPILLGILLVLVGAWLLARRYLPVADFDRLWPVALVIVGLVLVVLSFRPGREP